MKEHCLLSIFLQKSENQQKCQILRFSLGGQNLAIDTHGYITIAVCGDQPLPPAALSKT